MVADHVMLTERERERETQRERERESRESTVPIDLPES